MSDAPVYKVGDVHPVTGCVCVAVVEGSPRWDYPKGHPYYGRLEARLRDEAEDRAKKGRRW